MFSDDERQFKSFWRRRRRGGPQQYTGIRNVDVVKYTMEKSRLQINGG